jgi:tRNA isopentenyl-2-thiomethyl-A-37 hydroxylase MiaE
MVLCARQLLQVVSRAYSEYWKSRAAHVAALGTHIAELDAIRAELIESQDPDFRKFLDWFDAWFLKRAAAVERADD